MFFSFSNHGPQILTVLSVLTVVTALSTATQTQAQVNCSVSDVCGPICCPGLQCSYRRGIPICHPYGTTFTAGTDRGSPCSDPYLNSCDNPIGLPGSCCPIGTICYTDGTTSAISCIDALGKKTASLPAQATGFVVPAIPVSSSNATNIQFSPPGAWKTSATDANCTSNNVVYTTNAINATISFTYTGLSVQFHLLTALNGGVFSVIVDGLNTTTALDTYSGGHTPTGGSAVYPLCYPAMFPPFALVPPQYASRSNHTISLVLIGPSPNAMSNASQVVGQFNGFAIPELTPVANGAHISLSHGLWVLLLSIMFKWVSNILV